MIRRIDLGSEEVREGRNVDLKQPENDQKPAKASSDNLFDDANMNQSSSLSHIV